MTAKKYVPVRMPGEAYEAFLARKIKMENSIFLITGKREEIPMTKILTLSAKIPINMYNEDLIKIADAMKHTRGRKKTGMNLL